MYRILLTGISGVGKSTLTHALAERGYLAIDADTDTFSEWAKLSDADSAPGEPVESDRDWVWRVDRIAALLAAEQADVLFLSGCASNMGRFLTLFDQVILLSAPGDVIVDRLQTRTNNQYGKHPAEQARILRLIDQVEPLLRKIASHEIVTSRPLAEVIAQVLQLIPSQLPKQDSALG